ncbi:hypothetical protein G7054_g8290 [Neopestalotiopsis clavispora]|nr:hypothetical protein G7054_g8290 [Neopestalotiopsis clavispora]
MTSQGIPPRLHASTLRASAREPAQPQAVHVVVHHDDRQRQKAQEDSNESQEPPDALQDATTSLLSRIEDIIEGVVDRLQENRPLLIPMRSRRTGRDSAVLFPTASNTGARRFTLKSGVKITKRYIFYLNKDLFERQSYVDQIIDDIAFTFGVNRDALNIIATSKGLLAGGPFARELGETYSAVPEANSLANLEIRGIQWVLVIEKEATFRSLVAAKYFDRSVAGPGLLLTVLLSIFHSLGVKSCDIFCQEFTPSASTRSPTPIRSQQSLGERKPSLPAAANAIDVTHVGPLTQLTATDYKTNALTYTDRRKAASLLRIVGESVRLEAEELNLLRELQIMLMLSVKFEIQAVNGEGYMTSWLDERLSSEVV